MTFDEFLTKFSEFDVKKGYLQISWVTGGMTGGSCWGTEANIPVSAEPEPEFTALDEALEKICPHISFLQYKRLCQEVVELDTEGGYDDYYGNYYNRTIKRVHLRKLYNAL